MKRLLKITAGLLFLLLTLLLVAAFQLLDDTPLVHVSSEQLTPSATEDAKRLVKQLLDSRDNHSEQELVVSQQQLNHLFLLAHRAVPRVRADASIQSWGSVIRVSAQLPNNPIGDYLNLLVTLPPQAEGFELASVTMGGFTLGRDSAHLLRRQLLVWLLGDEVAQLLLHTVKRVETEHQQWRIHYQFAPDLDKKVLAALHSWQQYFSGDELRQIAVSTQFYYQHLCSAAWQRVSLSKPLFELTRLAASRSTDPDQASQENQALLQALTLYYGNSEHNYLFEKLLGLELPVCAAGPVTLAGRTDLAQHFLYSATIKILSDNQASFMVGEFKEMQDSLRGGSGFSFVDLLADQTGIRFAFYATNRNSALQLQRQAALLAREANFLAPTSGLREGLSQNEWETQYQQGGAAYQQQLAQIEQRIARTPFFSRLR